MALSIDFTASTFVFGGTTGINFGIAETWLLAIPSG